MPNAYDVRKRLPQNALGSAVFSGLISAQVPYFASILPYVKTMEPGYVEVSAPKWFGVRNHIGTFHAIACCNIAEVGMGMLMEASLPKNLRWIPKGMNVQYLKIANGRLTGKATYRDDIDFATITEGTDVVIAVQVLDKNGVEVVHAEITTWVSPK